MPASDPLPVLRVHKVSLVIILPAVQPIHILTIIIDSYLEISGKIEVKRGRPG